MTVFDVVARLAALTPEGPTEFGMTRICEISGVHERFEKIAAELWAADAGELFVRVFVEGGNRAGDIPLGPLVDWLVGNSVRHDISGNPKS